MQIPPDSHVLVADGRKFLLLRNHGSADAPDLKVELEQHQDDPADRDITTDRPGRAFTGTGASGIGAAGAAHRSAYSQTDHHQKAEDDFAATTAKTLNRMARDGGVKCLTVVAAPVTLGALRKHFDKHLDGVLAGTLAKELTNRPPPEIAAALVAA